MIYVDEIGRVYQNWKSYVEENVLPAGIMIAPRRGMYNFDSSNKVILDVYRTPTASAYAGIMSIAQTTTEILGVTALVAAPVGATLVALSVGAFSAVRSAIVLYDRWMHEQSMSIMDDQARASFLNLAGGIAVMTTAGATSIMELMATVGKTTEVSILILVFE